MRGRFRDDLLEKLLDRMCTVINRYKAVLGTLASTLKAQILRIDTC